MDKKKIIIILSIFLFFIISTLFLATFSGLKTIKNAQTNLRFGAIGDFEYGYKNNVGNKLTNRAPVELEKAVDFYNKNFEPKFVVEMGDMIESSGVKPEKAKRQLQEINAVFSKISAKRKYIFGNHDLRSLSKEEVRYELGMLSNHAYFDMGDWRFVFVDTNFDGQRNGADMGPSNYVKGFVSESEFAWLKEALKTERPTVIFSHHPFVMGENNVQNFQQVQKFFEQFPNIVLCVSGHEPGYGLYEVNGITYFVPANLTNMNALGSYATLEARYNNFTKKADVQIEHYGPMRHSVEIKKVLAQNKLWWVELLSSFKII